MKGKKQERGVYLGASSRSKSGSEVVDVEWSGSGKSLPEVFTLAQKAYEECLLFLLLFNIKKAFWHHKFQLTVDREDLGRDLTPAEQQDFDQWKRENKAAIHDWAGNFMHEFLLKDVAVSFWWEGEQAAKLAGPRVTLLDPANCEYSDKLGMERLKYRHGLSEEDLRQLEGNLQARYRRDSMVTFDENFGERFMVVKRAPAGMGFGTPRLKAAFPAIDRWKGLEAGDMALAQAARRVVRQHKIGHEIKGTTRAGLPTHFFKPSRYAGYKKYNEGRVGFYELLTNFDVEIVHVGVDPDLFEDVKWDEVRRHLGYAAGVFYEMMVGKMENASLLSLAKTEAEFDRAQVAGRMAELISKVWGCPFRVMPVWSSEPFIDPKLANDLLRFGVTQGSVSLNTLNERLCLNHQQEGERKDAERSQGVRWVPLYDANHAVDPATQDNGRPKGS